MTSEAFVENWNNMFPSSKIHPNDLVNPTETFLTNALVKMIRAISIDVDSSEFDAGSSDPDSVRRAKVTLFQYVNDLYRRLHNKKFHYFDLIHPSKSRFYLLLFEILTISPFSAPKKTLNLTQTLLNYVLYHLMVDDEVTNEVTTLINKRKELMAQKQRMLAEREKNKLQVQQGQRSMETFSRELEDVNQKISKEKKHPILKEHEENIQLKTKNTQKMAGLKIHIAELNSQCINEEDFAEIKS